MRTFQIYHPCGEPIVVVTTDDIELYLENRGWSIDYTYIVLSISDISPQPSSCSWDDNR